MRLTSRTIALLALFLLAIAVGVLSFFRWEQSKRLLPAAVQTIASSHDEAILLRTLAEGVGKRYVLELDWRTSDGTLLMSLAKRSDLRNLLSLMTYAKSIGYDLNSVDSAGRNALHYAIEAHNTLGLSWLLRNGADPLNQDRGGGTVLHTALHNDFVCVFAGLSSACLNDDVLAGFRSALLDLEESNAEVVELWRGNLDALECMWASAGLPPES